MDFCREAFARLKNEFITTAIFPISILYCVSQNNMHLTVTARPCTRFLLSRLQQQNCISFINSEFLDM